MDDDRFFDLLFRKWNDPNMINMADAFESNSQMFDEQIQKEIDCEKDRKKLLQLVECQKSFDFSKLFHNDEFIEKRFHFIGSGSFGNALILHMGRRRLKRIIKAIRCVPKKIAENISSGAMSYIDVYNELMCLKILSKLCAGVRLTEDKVPEESAEGDEYHRNSNIGGNDDGNDGENVQMALLNIRRRKRFCFKTNCFPKFYKAYLCRNENEALLNFDSLFSFDYYRPMHNNLETVIILMEYCGKPLNELIELEQIKAIAIISVLKQLIIGLAIAESIFYFEHRDLHLSNIICKETDSQWIKFIYKSQKYQVCSLGYEAKIIDFSYSRISYNEKIYYKNLNYLNNDRSSNGIGPYEEMAKLFETDQWHKYSNRSNIIWIKYLLQDLIKELETYYESSNELYMIMEYLQSLQDVLNECQDIFHLFNQLINDEFNKIVPFRCH